MEKSLSFEGRNLENTLPFNSPTPETENHVFGNAMSLKNKDFEDVEAHDVYGLSEDGGDESPRLNGVRERKMQPAGVSAMAGNRRYQAALRLQKVYKSFRTRRKLADGAVLAEQRWYVFFSRKKKIKMF